MRRGDPGRIRRPDTSPPGLTAGPPRHDLGITWRLGAFSTLDSSQLSPPGWSGGRRSSLMLPHIATGEILAFSHTPPESLLHAPHIGVG